MNYKDYGFCVNCGGKELRKHMFRCKCLRCAMLSVNRYLTHKKNKSRRFREVSVLARLQQTEKLPVSLLQELRKNREINYKGMLNETV